MHDFAPDKMEWIHSYVEGKHFEGVPASPGIAIGSIVVLDEDKIDFKIKAKQFVKI